jgi:hypothetical protein
MQSDAGISVGDIDTKRACLEQRDAEAQVPVVAEAQADVAMTDREVDPDAEWEQMMFGSGGASSSSNQPPSGSSKSKGASAKAKRASAPAPPPKLTPKPVAAESITPVRPTKAAESLGRTKVAESIGRTPKRKVADTTSSAGERSAKKKVGKVDTVRSDIAKDYETLLDDFKDMDSEASAAAGSKDKEQTLDSSSIQKIITLWGKRKGCLKASGRDADLDMVNDYIIKASMIHRVVELSESMECDANDLSSAAKLNEIVVNLQKADIEVPFSIIKVSKKAEQYYT